MQLRSTLLALSSISLLACDTPSTAPIEQIKPLRASITDGTLDGNRHPAVVLIIFDVDGAPAWRCSGTLIAPKVVLTAGHCPGEPGEVSGARVFTESDVENGDNNYPFKGPNTIEARKWQSHPQYTNARFFLHDVGVVILSREVKLAAGQYGQLPTVDQLDALQPSNSTKFTAVGYGLQRINPVFVQDDLVRMFSTPHLVQINTAFTGDFSLLLSNNASTGGTCFGDSGGPNYLGNSNVIAGVTSFGLNGTCGGTGGVFRLDRKNVLDFVGQFLR